MTERERIARIIDPSIWRVMDSYLAEVKRKPNCGYDPDNFKDQQSLTKADLILASRPDIGKVVEVLRPFAEFAPPAFVPDNHAMTQGSPMAKRQVTAADFRRASALLSELTTGRGEIRRALAAAMETVRGSSCAGDDQVDGGERHV